MKLLMMLLTVLALSGCATTSKILGGIGDGISDSQKNNKQCEVYGSGGYYDVNCN